MALPFFYFFKLRHSYGVIVPEELTVKPRPPAVFVAVISRVDAVSLLDVMAVVTLAVDLNP